MIRISSDHRGLLDLEQMKSSPLVLIAASSDHKGIEFADASLSLSNHYPEAIRAAGGLAWVLPCEQDGAAIAEAVQRCDGVLLTGGDDITPELYAPRLTPGLRRTVRAEDTQRDLFELLLIDQVFRQRKPLFAICRGHQMLNVALGGTLLVDVATQVPQALNHRRMDRKDEVVHEVLCAEHSLLARLTGRAILWVNSSHHQAVGSIAKPLRATAVSKDGIVESLELAPDLADLSPWLLSVQFHPERLWTRHEEHRTLFRSFVSACARARRRNV